MVLADCVALITGAGRGIGRAITLTNGGRAYTRPDFEPSVEGGTDENKNC
jgi:hypothetical protein